MPPNNAGQPQAPAPSGTPAPLSGAPTPLSGAAPVSAAPAPPKAQQAAPAAPAAQPQPATAASQARPAGNAYPPREARQLAGIPAVLRRWRWIPFFELDVIIADLTPAGLKIETHYDVRARERERFWLIVPALDQDGAESSHPPVVLQAECRWYAQKPMILGAVVTSIDRPGAERLVAMIRQLRDSGRGVV